MREVKPIQTEAALDAALIELEQIWDSDDDYVDALAAAIEAYETKHYPMDRGTIWMRIQIDLYVVWTCVVAWLRGLFRRS